MAGATKRPGVQSEAQDGKEAVMGAQATWAVEDSASKHFDFPSVQH